MKTLRLCSLLGSFTWDHDLEAVLIAGFFHLDHDREDVFIAGFFHLNEDLDYAHCWVLSLGS